MSAEPEKLNQDDWVTISMALDLIRDHFAKKADWRACASIGHIQNKVDSHIQLSARPEQK